LVFLAPTGRNICLCPPYELAPPHEICGHNEPSIPLAGYPSIAGFMDTILFLISTHLYVEVF
jgi:hypothetical protein